MTEKIAAGKCEVHSYHWPPPNMLHRHHVWPLGMGGPDLKENVITVCPTGHDNIHRALRALVRGLAVIGTRRERALAQRGYDSWVRKGRPTITEEGC